MILRATRFSGALALLAVGAVHLQQYAGSGYNQIPTIGPLFLLNAIACGLVGAGLLVPIETWLDSRRSEAIYGMLAAAGVLIAVASLVGLFISETSSLFGFSEDGYKTAIVVSIAAEAASAVLLGAVVAGSLVRLRAATRRRQTARPQGRTLRAV